MKKQLTPIIFWLLFIVFLVILCQFFVPAVQDLFFGPVFLLPMAIFSLLGVALIVSTVKEKIQGLMKKFLLLTGISATGFFVFIVLHNFFYALEIVFADIVILKYLMAGLHVISFLIAIFVCPIGFLAGLVGSAVLLIKRVK